MKETQVYIGMGAAYAVVGISQWLVPGTLMEITLGGIGCSLILAGLTELYRNLYSVTQPQ